MKRGIRGNNGAGNTCPGILIDGYRQRGQVDEQDTAVAELLLQGALGAVIRITEEMMFGAVCQRGVLHKQQHDE